MGVVDGLEAVQIDQQQGVVEATPGAVRQGRLELLAEPAPVRQAGQQVRSGDGRGARQGGAQPQMASPPEPSADEHDCQQGEPARLAPDPSVEHGRAGVGERPEVLAEDIEAIGVDLPQVGELRGVE